MPKISVIIPVYNVREFLGKCLASLEAQTFKDFEAIIVDDGSPDASYEVYESYSARDSRFRHIRMENGGVSRARNAGLSMVRGEYVLFIDSDDWLPEKALEILYGTAQSTGADLTVADVTVVHSDGREERVHVFEEGFVTEDPSFIGAYKRAVLGYAYNPLPYGGRCLTATGLGGPWNKLVRHDFLTKHDLQFDPYVLGIFDDCLFTLNILECSNKIAYVAESVYYYRMVETSLLHAYKANMLEVNARIFKRIEQYIGKSDDSDFYRPAYAFYVVRRFDETLKNYFFVSDNPKSFKERLHEVRKVITSEPYSSAFSAVEWNKLNRYRKLICKYGAKGNAWAIWAVWKLKQIKQG